jgi:uncharacterized protein (DUF4415 family)
MSVKFMIPNPDLTEPDNPEWKAADFARALGPDSLSEAELAAFPKSRRGRPRLAEPKRQVTIRLSQEALRLVQADKPGWNRRLEAALMTSGVPAAISNLIVGHREMIEALRKQIKMMETGQLRLIADGNKDITAEAISDTTARAARLEALVYHYTPPTRLG